MPLFNPYRFLNKSKPRTVTAGTEQPFPDPPGSPPPLSPPVPVPVPPATIPPGAQTMVNPNVTDAMSVVHNSTLDDGTAIVNWLIAPTVPLPITRLIISVEDQPNGTGAFATVTRSDGVTERLGPQMYG